jgi:hypothetical protein
MANLDRGRHQFTAGADPRNKAEPVETSAEQDSPRTSQARSGTRTAGVVGPCQQTSVQKRLYMYF